MGVKYVGILKSPTLDTSSYLILEYDCIYRCAWKYVHSYLCNGYPPEKIKLWLNKVTFNCYLIQNITDILRTKALKVQRNRGYRQPCWLKMFLGCPWSIWANVNMPNVLRFWSVLVILLRNFWDNGKVLNIGYTDICRKYVSDFEVPNTWCTI